MEVEGYQRICTMDAMSSDFDDPRRTAEATYAKFPLDPDNLTRVGEELLEFAQFPRDLESKKMVLDAIYKLEEALEVDPRKRDTVWSLGNEATPYFYKAAQYFIIEWLQEPSNELYMKSSEVAAKGSSNRYICLCCKSCARKRRTIYLPQEMVFEILSHLPALVLRDVMRHVSHDWNLIVHSRAFTQHHARNSNSGVLIQDRIGAEAIYVEMRRGCLEISKLDYGFKNLAHTSCNGLVLLPDSEIRRDILHVVNPVTQQRTILPPYLHKTKDHVVFGLAFVEASVEYKVVCVYPEESYCPRTHIYVLTVGVDKAWRSIDIKHLHVATEGDVYYHPWVTRGYVHWIGKTFTLTLNVETEAVSRFPAPQLSRRSGNILAMGSNVSFVSRANKHLRDVWEMNPKTGKLTKTLRFDLRPMSSRVADFFEETKAAFPCCWLVAREVLLFRIMGITRHCIAYNLKNRETQLIELGTCETKYHFEAHVNSLVSLEGGF